MWHVYAGMYAITQSRPTVSFKPGPYENVHSNQTPWEEACGLHLHQGMQLLSCSTYAFSNTGLEPDIDI
ncbi:hypothetical protein EWB00_000212, partial [Schistosoma japonicum]